MTDQRCRRGNKIKFSIEASTTISFCLLNKVFSGGGLKRRIQIQMSGLLREGERRRAGSMVV